MEYPYQIVAFFGKQPEIGDLVYNGPKGWFPQLAIKRRFKFDGYEQSMLVRLRQLAKTVGPFTVEFGKVSKPTDMPVDVIEVKPNKALSRLHSTLFINMGPSKYPDREAAGYYPHMTISWRGERVVDPSKYENTSQTISEIWVLKDDGPDSRALARFKLGSEV